MFGASKTKQVSSAANYIEDVFSTYLYTGNGSTQTITNGIDLAGKGGLVWTKQRVNDSTGWYHMLTDTARGNFRPLFSNTTDAEFTGGSSITAFNSNGFSAGGAFGSNNTIPYVSWTFRKQPKFFDVVTFTRGSGAQTVNHSLGSTPGCIIVKNVSSASNWLVYHRSYPTQVLQLNTTSALISDPSIFPSAPTSTTFTLDAFNSGDTIVAYIFAHNAGGFGLTGTDNVISCGSWSGNGSTQDINLGYEPQYILLKNVTLGYNWVVSDTMRGMDNTSSSWVYANTSAAEASNTPSYLIPTATGFTVNTSTPTYNASGSTYIYIAIRRGPMKVPTDGTKVFAPVLHPGTGPTELNAGFPPDLAIIGNRDGAAYQQNWLGKLPGGGTPYVASTGARLLASPSTAAEVANNYFYLGQNGFGVNTSYTTSDVMWNFRRAPSFFDEVCYTGTGSATTVTHNLGVAPTLWIVKKRSSAESWVVGYTSGGANAYLTLQTTDATANDSGVLWNNALPTSTVLNLGGSTPVNGSGSTYVAYLFATCAGVSKVGSYTGNGSTQTINCGFAGGARFVLIKRTDSTGNWYVYDTARGMTTLTDPYLFMNSGAAEVATLGSVTTVTTGFAVNASILAAINTNAASYIFLAIA